MPNTEVKPLNAESTWLETAREDRKLPVRKSTPLGVLFSYTQTYISLLFGNGPRRSCGGTYVKYHKICENGKKRTNEGADENPYGAQVYVCVFRPNGYNGVFLSFFGKNIIPKNLI